ERQRDLVLAAFQAAPELIADYFHKKSTFSFEPKLTATWVGYAAFLLSTIQLPIGKQLVTWKGHGSILPPTSDLVESILPPPLTSKVLSRCLNQSVGVIKFFAVQILNAAFNKLAYVIHYFRQAGDDVRGTRCASAASDVLNEFSQRCPDMNHVVILFKSCTANDTTLREASGRLLSLYYQHLPQKALEHKFDISVALSAFVNDVLSTSSQSKESGIQSLVFEHLLKIASCSPDPPDTAFNFVDDLLQRLSKKGVKYHQDLLLLTEQIDPAAKNATEAPLGGFLMVLMEQWPFIQRSATKVDLESLSKWVSRLFLIMDRISKGSKLSHHVRDFIKHNTTSKGCKKLLEKTANEEYMPEPKIPLGSSPNIHETRTSQTLSDNIPDADQHKTDAWEPPSPPLPEDDNHPGLVKWKHLEVEEAVVEGAIGELALCLCSKYVDIRKQALAEVRSWMKRLLASSYSEREPLYLLTGELVETVKDSISDTALPYFAGVMVTELSQILADPLHFLYAKVNKFLNKGPTWKVEKLPSYWVEQILMRVPTVDDAHYKEISWLLDVLVDGLRSPEDMDFYRRCHILERLLSLAASPSLPARYLDKLFSLLFRCIHVGGGTTLITSIPVSLAFAAISGAPPIPSNSHTLATTDCLIPPTKITITLLHRTLPQELSMARRYTRGELEHLRASPLVARPPRLPPIEEWMGPLPDPNQKKAPNRGKNEETPAHDGNSRRPMFERHMSRGSSNGMLQGSHDVALFTNLLHSVPEDIVLGPPRTAFASAAGARHSRNSDSQARSNSGAQGEDSARGDRQNYRDKYARQSTRDDADGEGSQQARSGNQQHRKATIEHDSWSGRQSRVPAQDDTERGARSNGYRDQDRDKDGNPVSRPARGFDNHRRDAMNDETNDTRRNGHGRGRNEPSWYRDEKDGEADGRRDTTRARDWRDKNRASARGADLDWSQNAKPETDPEWMDEPDVQEKKQAHTQEDFERWKERMKAGSNGPNQENAPPSGDQRPTHERTFSSLTSPAAKTKAETPLVIDPSIDGFFGQWNDPAKKENITSEGATQGKAETKIKAAKASKFTGFFGAKPPRVEQEAEVPAASPFTASADSSTEDKEGFQRILKLLDQQQTIPPKDTVVRDHMARHVPTSPTAQRQQQAQSNLQSLLSPQSKNGGPLPPNKDSEFLLNLMRQSRQANPTDSRLGGNGPPELLPFSNLVVSPQQTPAPPTLPPPPPGFLESIARQEAQSHDKLNPTPTPDRKRPPPGLFNGQPHELAPSILSPPGPQRQGMMPPPGFQTPLRNPNQFPPGLLANMQSPGQVSGNAFNVRMAPSNGASAMPPPGFTNNPPPGFSPMPMNQDGGNRMFFGGPPRPEGFGEAGMDFNFGQFRRQE
ncbi:MAG: hypothetical protein Q9218_007312, partial [Villophora microphyllina]